MFVMGVNHEQCDPSKHHVVSTVVHQPRAVVKVPWIVRHKKGWMTTLSRLRTTSNSSISAQDLRRARQRCRLFRRRRGGERSGRSAGPQGQARWDLDVRAGANVWSSTSTRCSRKTRPQKKSTRRSRPRPTAAQEHHGYVTAPLVSIDSRQPALSEHRRGLRVMGGDFARSWRGTTTVGYSNHCVDCCATWR